MIRAPERFRFPARVGLDVAHCVLDPYAIGELVPLITVCGILIAVTLVIALLLVAGIRIKFAWRRPNKAA